MAAAPAIKCRQDSYSTTSGTHDAKVCDTHYHSLRRVTIVILTSITCTRVIGVWRSSICECQLSICRCHRQTTRRSMLRGGKPWRRGRELWPEGEPTDVCDSQPEDARYTVQKEKQILRDWNNIWRQDYRQVSHLAKDKSATDKLKRFRNSYPFNTLRLLLSTDGENRKFYLKRMPKLLGLWCQPRERSIVIDDWVSRWRYK